MLVKYRGVYKVLKGWGGMDRVTRVAYIVLACMVVGIFLFLGLVLASEIKSVKFCESKGFEGVLVNHCINYDHNSLVESKSDRPVVCIRSYYNTDPSTCRWKESPRIVEVSNG